jgi:hypothetical protein
VNIMTTRTDYERDHINHLAKKLLGEGYRVFIAERGTYGFYTNEAGSPVVSFQSDLGGISYAGNYKSSRCGTGWGLDLDTPEAMLQAATYPPRWATSGENVTVKTLEQHLDQYQKSSKYEELSK